MDHKIINASNSIENYQLHELTRFFFLFLLMLQIQLEKNELVLPSLPVAR